MKVQSRVAARADRNGGIFLGGFVALAAVVTLLLAPMVADSAGPGPVGKSDAVKFEDIPGSTVKRVILTAKSAERLGIETGKVGKKSIILRQMVGGRVILPVEKQLELKPAGGGFGGFGPIAAAPASQPASGGFAGFGPIAAVQAPQPVAESAKRPASGEAWVLVTLSPGEWDRLQKDKPARVLPLATRDKFGKEVLAQPSGMPPVEDMKRSMLTLYYVVPGKDHGLAVNNRMRVELQLSGTDEKQTVVPYGAVYYDAKGTAWVYVNPKPLLFERQHIVVERVVGDLAVLSKGPPVGTRVVTVGAALLFGAEVVFRR